MNKMDRFRGLVHRVMNKRDARLAMWDPDVAKLSFVQTVPWVPSPSEISLLRRSWSSQPVFLNQFGLRVYHEIFGRHPSTKKMFTHVLKNPRNWTTDPLFQAHSRKFTEVLVYTLKNLENMREIEFFLHELGFLHTKLAFESKHFRICHWELFKEALVAAVRAHVQREPIDQNISIDLEVDEMPADKPLSAQEQKMVMVYWNHLIDFMVQKMFFGFSEGLIVERRRLEDEQEKLEAPKQPALFKKHEQKIKLLEVRRQTALRGDQSTSGDSN